MQTIYTGYMGKVMLADLSTETVSEYPLSDEQRELYLGGKIMKKLYYVARVWDKNGIPRKDLNSCVILVNGNSANKRSKLADGDTVVLMSPVAGG